MPPRSTQSLSIRQEVAVLVFLFTTTLFLSSALLFCVQPLIGKILLPLLGGVPAIWNTCMFFFQFVLLLGYLYSHFITRRLKTRGQLTVHGIVILSVIVFLPLALPAHLIEGLENGAAPIPWLLAALLLSVGGPFFAVSTSAPLIQRWFSLLPHHRAQDPYFLYAASNVGSFVGLVGYLFFFEPFLTVGSQGWAWAVGYGAFVLLLGVCGYALWKWGAEQEPASALNFGEISKPRLGRWIFFAFLPSSLLLSSTTYLSSEIGSVPLLWVVPLIIYLLSFVVVFSPRFPNAFNWASRWYGLFVLPLVVVIAIEATQPSGLVIPLHLLTFWLAALIAHGRLAQDRPAPKDLTTFYLCLSIGGALGGLFNAVVAPELFNRVWEYPVGLLAVAFLRVDFKKGSSSHTYLRDLGIAFGVAVLVLIGSWAASGLGLGFGRSAKVLTFVVPLLVCYFFVGYSRRFALVLTFVFIAGNLLPSERGRELLVSRNFFGVLRVTEDHSGMFRQLIHGNTIHGRQYIDPEKQEVQLLYYGRKGPMGQIFDRVNHEAEGTIAVIGLGTGSLACYVKPTQKSVFFEIDPEVVEVARDSGHFSFLSRCGSAESKIVVGDARVSLKRVPPSSFDILVVDAFSSDAIPVHLATLEAMKLYLSKLTENGVIVMHISNRYLDLRPVLASHAEELDIEALSPPAALLKDPTIGTMHAEWVLLIRRNHPKFESLASHEGWTSLGDLPRKIRWTDGFSNPLSILK